MNRAERRKYGIKTRAKTYTLNDSQIKQIKADAVKEAIDTAFIYMLGLPVMIIHDKYPQLMKKVVDGKCREERFTDLLLDLYDSVNKGYVSFEDLTQCLKDECGIEIEQQFKEKMLL